MPALENNVVIVSYGQGHRHLGRIFPIHRDKFICFRQAGYIECFNKRTGTPQFLKTDNVGIDAAQHMGGPADLGVIFFL